MTVTLFHGFSGWLATGFAAIGVSSLLVILQTRLREDARVTTGQKEDQDV